MLKSKTVFILGAGASFEIGFPLGTNLKVTISEKLDYKLDSLGYPIRGDIAILDKLRSKFTGTMQDYFNTCTKISNGILWSNSIDDFIDIHKDDEKVAICGKLAIAYSIMDAEAKVKKEISRNNLTFDIDYKIFKNTWYSRFYSLISKQVPKNNLDQLFENITVINFNYDRSFEYFLVHVIAKNYMISIDDSKKIVDNLQVYRPYGSIDKYVEFGTDIMPNIDNILSNLKTYTEQVDDEVGLKKVRNAIQESSVIVFLGMAYHVNNMKLLSSNCLSEKSIYATRFGISDADLGIVRQRVNKMLNSPALTSFTTHNINFSDTCVNLFDTYQLLLSEH